MPTNPAIRLQNVCFAYNREDVLHDVSLSLDSGAFLAVIGPNGGGKTTLVKLMLGLLKPRHGSVEILGHAPCLSVPCVGYVPQYTAFDPEFPITVLEVVLLGLKRKHSRRLGAARHHTERALEVLAKVDMKRFAHRRFDELSGGQRQRVLIGRALMSEPDLLLFDEPTANIDPNGKLCLFDLLKDLCKGLTVVMVSHDLISASAGITDVAVVNRTLIQGREITPDMLELIYGVHDSTCPLDGYLKSLSQVFDTPESLLLAQTGKSGNRAPKSQHRRRSFDPHVRNEPQGGSND